MHYLTLTVHAGYIQWVVSVEDGANGGLKVIASGSDPNLENTTYGTATLDVIGRLVDLYGGLVDIDIIHAD
jgi:hypothetical protein